MLNRLNSWPGAGFVVDQVMVALDGGRFHAGILHNGLGRYFLHAHRRAAVRLVSADELGGHGVFAQDHVVAVHNHERLAAGEGPGHEHRVAQAQGLFLPHKENVGEICNAEGFLQQGLFARLCEGGFQLGAAVEVVFDDAFVAAENDEDLLDARVHSLFHDILDGGLVHNGQHLLGHCFGGRQHPCAKPCRGDDRLAYFLCHIRIHSFHFSFRGTVFKPKGARLTPKCRPAPPGCPKWARRQTRLQHT